jgi:hypothetical protein
MADLDFPAPRAPGAPPSWARLRKAEEQDDKYSGSLDPGPPSHTDKQDDHTRDEEPKDASFVKSVHNDENDLRLDEQPQSHVESMEVEKDEPSNMGTGSYELPQGACPIIDVAHLHLPPLDQVQNPCA